MEIIETPIESIILSDYNPREITDHDYQALKNSISEFGFVEPIVVNKTDNRIVGGHMRYRAATDLGIKTVPCIFIELTENKAKILNIALNRISGRWDIGKLEKLVYDISQLPDLDIKLTGLEDWELKLYNPGDKSDINVDEMWQNMPEYGVGREKPYQTVFVHFRSEEDVKNFAELVNQKITEYTKYIWIPYREKEDIKSVKVVTEDK